jgi:hypothetical protein
MIYGNLEQQNLLKEMVEKNTSPILISGPEGVGKFSFCFEYLKEKKFEKIFFSTADKIFKIESARFLTSLAQKKTEKRIVLIDEVHKFKSDSQNTLLKTLEEAPSKTIFILITHQENKILPTIHSRSLKIKFSLVPESETAKFLKEKGFSQDEIKLALEFFPFQPGKAFQFLIQKNKFEILKKFLLGEMTDNLKDYFSLKEILEYYLLFKRQELLKSLGDSKKINETLLRLRSALNLYFDADYNLNFDLQLTNLILNNG